MANLFRDFFGLVFLAFQAPQKLHAQNIRPELSAFLSNFTFSDIKMFHADFLLTGDINICPKKIRYPERGGVLPQGVFATTKG